MKVIAAIQADLETTPIGTRSRLGHELAAVPVLRRTVDRVRSAKTIAEVHVLCPTPQASRCAAILQGTGVLLRPHDLGTGPYGSLIQAARKWSLAGWRGGIGGTTAFDEYADVRLINGLLQDVRADAVLGVPPAAVLFDPDLADRMVDYRRTLEQDSRLVFTQAPPGLAGILLDATLVSELAAQNIPIGWLFSYQPDGPRKDLIFQPCCYETPACLRFAAGRVIADTDRSTRALAELLRQHPEPDSNAVGHWLIERDADFVEPLPREVEIELTTDDPYPDSLLRPRGDRVPDRGPIDLGVVRRIVDELTSLDDSLVVLGGFGEPLRHPRFREILDILRPSDSMPPALPHGREDSRLSHQSGKTQQRAREGVYGLCVRTAGVDLDEAAIDTIVDHDVDVVNVILDAWSPVLYGRLHAQNHPASAPLEKVLARLDHLSKVREHRASARPIVVPEMTKARDNITELDDFFDGWLRRLGAASLTGYSHRARQTEDRSVMTMAPSARVPCRRIQSRCLVLADGWVVLCDQDFQGRHRLGNLQEQSLSEIWMGPALLRLREMHRKGAIDPTLLCAACDEWHRP